MPAATELIAHFSYPAIFGLLLACGLGAPLSEELILLAAGALVAKGVCHPAPAVATAMVGVLAGDLALFSLGRRLGKRRVGRFVGAKLANRISRWGALAVFAARFVAGARACTFAACGALGFPRRRFAFADALGAVIWVPMVVLVGRRGFARIENHLPALAVGAAVIAASVLIVRRLRAGTIVAVAEQMEDAGP